MFSLSVTPQEKLLAKIAHNKDQIKICLSHKNCWMLCYSKCCGISHSHDSGNRCLRGYYVNSTFKGNWEIFCWPTTTLYMWGNSRGWTWQTGDNDLVLTLTLRGWSRKSFTLGDSVIAVYPAESTVWHVSISCQSAHPVLARFSCGSTDTHLLSSLGIMKEVCCNSYCV